MKDETTKFWLCDDPDNKKDRCVHFLCAHITPHTHNQDCELRSRTKDNSYCDDCKPLTLAEYAAWRLTQT